MSPAFMECRGTLSRIPFSSRLIPDNLPVTGGDRHRVAAMKYDDAPGSSNSMRIALSGRAPERVFVLGLGGNAIRSKNRMEE
jgi:hypothetical protein